MLSFIGSHVHHSWALGCLATPSLLSLFCPHHLCVLTCLQRMVKTSEKPRLRQIPSSEDMEAEGMEAGAESSEQARACVEPARPGSSGKEPERPQKMLQPQEELILQQVGKEWQGWGCKKWNSPPVFLHFRALFYVSWCHVKLCTNPAVSWLWESSAQTQRAL